MERANSSIGSRALISALAVAVLLAGGGALANGGNAPALPPGGIPGYKPPTKPNPGTIDPVRTPGAATFNPRAPSAVLPAPGTGQPVRVLPAPIDNAPKVGTGVRQPIASPQGSLVPPPARPIQETVPGVGSQSPPPIRDRRNDGIVGDGNKNPGASLSNPVDPKLGTTTGNDRLHAVRGAFGAGAGQENPATPPTSGPLPPDGGSAPPTPPPAGGPGRNADGNPSGEGKTGPAIPDRGLGQDVGADLARSLGDGKPPRAAPGATPLDDPRLARGSATRGTWKDPREQLHAADPNAVPTADSARERTAAQRCDQSGAADCAAAREPR